MICCKRAVRQDSEQDRLYRKKKRQGSEQERLDGE
jgi:hypothetical protein